MMPVGRPVAWVAVATLVAAGGCAGSEAPEPFPEETAAALAARLAARDAAAIASFYTEDAVLLPPDMEPVSGRAAIQEFFARTHAGGAPRVELATVETYMLGDHAWRQGTFRLDGPGEGEPVAGKFVELWKKSGGRWLVHRDIWNANAPPPAAPEPEPDEPA
jgi:uncharacterized protein (TIGR02246 family)